MLIPIPMGTVHDARITGAVVREVACQHCHRPFYFILRRTGKGRAQADFFIGMESADRKASEKARADLERRLSRDLDPVPCPTCGRYPVEMVAAARRRLYRWRKIIGVWALAHFGGGYLTFLLLPSAPSLLYFLPGLLGFSFLLVRRMTFDPNRSPANAERVRRLGGQSYPTVEAALSVLPRSG